MGRVHVYENHMEALALQHLLQEKEIPAMVHSFEEWGVDGIFRSQMGMGEIIVPDGQEEEAREAIAQFMAERDGRKDGGDAGGEGADG